MLRHWAVDIRRFGRYGLFVLSKRRLLTDAMSYRRTLESSRSSVLEVSR